jgi:hypothetical protein
MNSTADDSVAAIRMGHRALSVGSCALLAALLFGCGATTTSPGESSSAGVGTVGSGGTTAHGLAGDAGTVVVAAGGVGGSPSPVSAGAGALAGGTSSAGAPPGFDLASIDITDLDAAFCETKRGCCAPLTIEHAEVLRVCAPSSGALDLILRGLAVADRQAIQACTAAYRAAAQSCNSLDIQNACRGFVAATQSIGEPCLTLDDAKGQCKGDADTQAGAIACVPTGQPATVNGVCTKLLHGRAGDLCDASCPAKGCQFWSAYNTSAPVGCFESDGLACGYPKDGARKCQAISKRGEACDLESCAGGDVCGSLGPNSNSTVCMAPALLDQYCGGGCAEGLACGALTCQPYDTLGADDSSCDNHIESSRH